MVDGIVQVVSEKSDEGGDRDTEIKKKNEKVIEITERLYNENQKKKEEKLKLQ